MLNSRDCVVYHVTHGDTTVVFVQRLPKVSFIFFLNSQEVGDPSGISCKVAIYS